MVDNLVLSLLMTTVFAVMIGFLFGFVYFMAGNKYVRGILCGFTAIWIVVFAFLTLPPSPR